MVVSIRLAANTQGVSTNAVYLSSFIIPPQIPKEKPVRKFILFLFSMLAAIILAACGSANTDAPAQAVEEYWNVIVAKDADRLPTLVCGDYEEEALTVLDSLQAVTARLDAMACTQTGTDGDSALVNCTGNLVLTYDAEDQNLDLSVFTYEVIEEGGDWL